MAQRLPLDLAGLTVYLGLASLACAGAPGRLLPEGARPVNSARVAEWVQATTPHQSTLHRFKWLFRDERSSAGGRGSARVAPPDSLRFDVAGPFGTGATSAVLVGDRAVWVQPPDAVRKLVPDYSLLWGLFGVARPPDQRAELRGLFRKDLTAWQYSGASDTVEYVRTAEGLTTEVRSAGKVIGRAEATLGPDGVPLKSRLTVPSVPARLDVTFLKTTRTAFAPEIWLPRKR